MSFAGAPIAVMGSAELAAAAISQKTTAGLAAKGDADAGADAAWMPPDGAAAVQRAAPWDGGAQQARPAVVARGLLNGAAKRRSVCCTQANS